MTVRTTPTNTTRKFRRMAREPGIEHAGAPPVTPTPDRPELPSNAWTSRGKRITKTDVLLGLLRREEGATLKQMVAATGWLSHTTRAALTGLKKKDHKVTSEKADGLRTYRITRSGDAA